MAHRTAIQRCLRNCIICHKKIHVIKVVDTIWTWLLKSLNAAKMTWWNVGKAMAYSSEGVLWDHHLSSSLAHVWFVRVLSTTLGQSCLLTFAWSQAFFLAVNAEMNQYRRGSKWHNRYIVGLDKQKVLLWLSVDSEMRNKRHSWTNHSILWRQPRAFSVSKSNRSKGQSYLLEPTVYIFTFCHLTCRKSRKRDNRDFC